MSVRAQSLQNQYQAVLRELDEVRRAASEAETRHQSAVEELRRQQQRHLETVKRAAVNESQEEVPTQRGFFGPSLAGSLAIIPFSVCLWSVGLFVSVPMRVGVAHGRDGRCVIRMQEDKRQVLEKLRETRLALKQAQEESVRKGRLISSAKIDRDEFESQLKEAREAAQTAEEKAKKTEKEVQRKVRNETSPPCGICVAHCQSERESGELF